MVHRVLANQIGQRSGIADTSIRAASTLNLEVPVFDVLVAQSEAIE